MTNQIVNTNLATGIRYGVMALNNLHPDLVHELWYGPGATDLSYQAAVRDIEADWERKADDIEEECSLAVSERDGNMTEADREKLLHDEIEAAYERLGFQDREDYIECNREMQCQGLEIQEPTIEGQYEGVKYTILWLGGSPLLYITESPVVVLVRSLCSPCVPNAGDLDSGLDLDGYPCYGPLPGWTEGDTP